MNETKPSAYNEPWEVVRNYGRPSSCDPPSYLIQPVDQSHGEDIALCPGDRPDIPERIIACVNGCRGIQDPANLVRVLRRVRDMLAARDAWATVDEGSNVRRSIEWQQRHAADMAMLNTVEEALREAEEN